MRHVRCAPGVTAPLLAVLVLLGVGCADDPTEPAASAVQDEMQMSEDFEDHTADFAVEVWSSAVPAPTDMAFLPDGTSLVTDKGGYGASADGPPSMAGVIHLDAAGTALGTALELPVCSEAERGLNGIALHPDFPETPYVYLYYTRQMAGCHAGDVGEVPPPELQVFNRLSRFTWTGDRLDPASEAVLIDGIPAFQSAHNGGGLVFAPDGKLFVGIGDSQLKETPPDTTAFGGKILRVDVDTMQAAADNPFATGATTPAQAFVWASGFRNPYRFGVDPADGRLVVADVGDETYEELDLVEPGLDYGWPASEGPDGDTGQPPFAWYTHGSSCGAIIGGPFSRASTLGPTYEGWNIFGDFGCGRIWAVEITDGAVSGARLIADADVTLTNIEIGPDGALYLGSTGGIIARLTATPS